MCKTKIGETILNFIMFPFVLAALAVQACGMAIYVTFCIFVVIQAVLLFFWVIVFLFAWIFGIEGVPTHGPFIWNFGD